MDMRNRVSLDDDGAIFEPFVVVQPASPALASRAASSGKLCAAQSISEPRTAAFEGAVACPGDVLGGCVGGVAGILVDSSVFIFGNDHDRTSSREYVGADVDGALSGGASIIFTPIIGADDFIATSGNSRRRLVGTVFYEQRRPSRAHFDDFLCAVISTPHTE